MSNIDALITYSVTDAAIASMRAEYMALKVKDFDDKTGYQVCKAARLQVKAKRVEVEKRRVELKAESLDFGRKVDAEAKRISLKLAEVEDHLSAQEAIVDAEKERRVQEALRLTKERLESRIAELRKLEYSGILSLDELGGLSTTDYDKLHAVTAEQFARTQASRAAEAERLKVLEAERLAQAAALAKQEAETRRLQDELLAKQRAEIAAAEEATRKEREAAAAKEIEHQKEIELIQFKANLAAQAAADKAALELAAKKKAEAAAAKQIADKAMFDEIKRDFPTLESAWIEIARLRKL